MSTQLWAKSEQWALRFDPARRLTLLIRRDRYTLAATVPGHPREVETHDLLEKELAAQGASATELREFALFRMLTTWRAA
jgi:hypothetical protein